MPTLSTVNLDFSLGQKPKHKVTRGKQKWQKVPSHQLSWPNVSIINVTFQEKEDCLKRVLSFDNIDIVQEYAKYDENLKRRSIFLEQSENQNLTGTRRKTKCNGCTRKGSILKSSKQNRRSQSFNHKHLDLKSIFKGILITLTCLLISICQIFNNMCNLIK